MQASQLTAPAPRGPAAHRLAGIVSTLIDAGHLHAKDILTGGLSVIQMGMSNEVIRLSVGDVPRFFVKSFSRERPDGQETLERERAAQRLVASPSLSGGDSVLPTPVALPDADDVVIWSAVDGTPAWFATDIDRAFCLALAGRALGRLHAADPAPFAHLTARQPWVLSLGREAPPQTIENDEGALAMIADALSRPGIVDGLARAQARWHAGALIHGDAKLDNMILTGGATPRICLIDWELAGLGDPAWDLAGALLQTSLETSASGDGFPGLVDAAEALLRCYGHPVTAELLNRLVLFSACWLVQTAIQFASASQTHGMMEPGICGLADRLFTDQRALAADLERRIY
jgi:aminoglycoside phosphotransferase (APT) family kinase protein